MSYQIGCTIISADGRGSEIFREALFKTGKEICDTCPRNDCNCTSIQAGQMQKAEDDFREANESPTVKKIQKAREAHEKYVRYGRLKKKDRRTA